MGEQVQNLLTQGVEALLADDTVSSAIRSTDEQLFRSHDYEGVATALEAWCRSSEFQTLFEAFAAGRSAEIDDDVVAGFREVSQTAHDADACETIITTFFFALQTQLITTTNGLYSTLRMEALFAEQRVLIQSLGGRLTSEQRPTGILEPAPEGQRADGRAEQRSDIDIQLDLANELIDSGDLSAAGKILDRVEALVDPAENPDAAFKLATRRAACAARLGDKEAATRYTDEALLLRPDDATAKANAAFGALLAGNAPRARELARSVLDSSPEHDQAAARWIDAASEMGDAQAVEEFVERNAWLRDAPMSALALGQHLRRQGEYERAEEALRRACDLTDRSPDAVLALAGAIAEPIQLRTDEAMGLPWQRPEEDCERLREAEGLVTEVIDRLAGTDDAGLLHDARQNRIAIRLRLRDVDAAHDDIATMLAADPRDPAALSALGRLRLREGNLEEAITALESAVDASTSDYIPLAHAYIHVGRAQDAIELLSSVIDPGSGDSLQLIYADLLGEAYEATGNAEGLEGLLAELERAFPDDSRAKAVRAGILNRVGRTDEAIDLLSEAVGEASGPSRARIALDLADLLMIAKRYAEAASYYESTADTSTDNETSRAYLAALYNAGDLSGALALCRKLRDAGPISWPVLQVEIAVLKYTGNLRAAIELLAREGDGQPEQLLALAELHYRNRDAEAAVEAIERIEDAEIWQDVELLIGVGQMRALLGLDDVLPVAARARDLAKSGDPRPHLAYVQLFRAREVAGDELIQAPEVAGVGSTVVLKEEGRAAKAFHLVDEADADPLRDRHAISTEFGQLLEGCAAGEEIVLQRGLGEIRAKVVELKSTYVHAFQETLEMFSTWFPDNAAIRRFDVSDGPESVLRVVDEQHERMVALTQLYQDRRMPVGALADLAGRSLLETWLGLASTPGQLVIVANGTPDDFAQAQVVSQSNRVAIDLTALLTCVLLEQEGSLLTAFDTVYVAQQVVDELSEWRSKQLLVGTPSGSLAKDDDGNYVALHSDPAAADDLISRTTAFLAACEVVPANARLEIPQDQIDAMHEAFGASSIASALVAKEQNVPLLADDLGLRVYAAREFGVSGTWVQGLLRAWRLGGRLTEDEYRNASRRLAASGYRFVEINATDLVWLLEQTEWQVTSEVAAAFGALANGSCSEAAAIGVAADVLKATWLAGLMPHRQIEILRLCLQVLVSGRNVERVVSGLKQTLRARMLLAPIALDDLLATIDGFSGNRRVLI